MGIKRYFPLVVSVILSLCLGFTSGAWAERRTLAQEQNFTLGPFEGIGLEIQAKDGQIVIVAPVDGSPAQRAGLHSGQIIRRDRFGEKWMIANP